jgi:hypothetical protein
MTEKYKLCMFSQRWHKLYNIDFIMATEFRYGEYLTKHEQEYCVNVV